MGNMTDTLKAKGMWPDTLVVFSADNGGWPAQSGDNTPLEGGKFADLEGEKKWWWCGVSGYNLVGEGGGEGMR
jgi:arylsulfatase A-like enzyme